MQQDKQQSIKSCLWVFKCSMITVGILKINASPGITIYYYRIVLHLLPPVPQFLYCPNINHGWGHPRDAFIFRVPTVNMEHGIRSKGWLALMLAQDTCCFGLRLATKKWTCTHQKIIILKDALKLRLSFWHVLRLCRPWILLRTGWKVPMCHH